MSLFRIFVHSKLKLSRFFYFGFMMMFQMPILRALHPCGWKCPVKITFFWQATWTAGFICIFAKKDVRNMLFLFLRFQKYFFLQLRHLKLKAIWQYREKWYVFLIELLNTRKTCSGESFNNCRDMREPPAVQNGFLFYIFRDFLLRQVSVAFKIILVFFGVHLTSKHIYYTYTCPTRA